MKSSIEYSNTKTALVEQLLDWLNQYAGVISAITGILTLFVWTFYAHLLYRNFRRQRLPRLMIQISPDLEQHSMCLLINMSQEVLDVVGIVVVGYSSQNIYKRKILDYEQFSRNWHANTSQEWRSLLKQGPLEVGGFIVLGSFESILHEVASPDCHPHSGKQTSEWIHTLEIRAIAFFGSENDPLGVYRAFNIAPKPEGIHIRPQTFKTQLKPQVGQIQPTLIKPKVYIRALVKAGRSHGMTNLMVLLSCWLKKLANLCIRGMWKAG